MYVGKPGGYDRVRNAEIGNKVRLNIVYANTSVLRISIHKCTKISISFHRILNLMY